MGFCNPLLDMTVVGNQDLLNKYDLKNNNAILAEDKHMPLYEELMKNDQIEYTAGGSGQNSLRVAQVLSLTNKTNSIFFLNVCIFSGFLKSLMYQYFLVLLAKTNTVTF